MWVCLRSEHFKARVFGWIHACSWASVCAWAPLTVSVCASPERSYRVRAGDSLRKLRFRHWAKFGTGFFYTRTGYFLFKKYLPVLENGMLSFGQTQPSSCNLTSCRVSRFSVRANDIKVCIIVDLNENSLFEGQLIKFSSDLISILPQTHKKSNQRLGEVKIVTWWWSSGQYSCLLLRWSKFESYWLL